MHSFHEYSALGAITKTVVESFIGLKRTHSNINDWLVELTHEKRIKYLYKDVYK